MDKWLMQCARAGAFILLFFTVIVSTESAGAAPYAAMVIDARSGEVLHEQNADSRLHPASLTKMMTLYVTFEAIKRGELSLDDRITISSKAASEPPSKLGLRAGQKVQLRYLIRAASIKSANDAATALGEAISGSESAFAARMNRTAKALGMNRTTFRNAHGLTADGHLSTARDMTTLGRRLFYDYPEYYNLFSRQTADAGIRQVSNTNRRLLSAYKGADGIKTGYTRAAGFNLVASAERGGERVIATVFGGRSSAARNAKVAELLDLGFNRAPSRVAVNKPAAPNYAGGAPSGSIAIATSLRPRGRPVPDAAPIAAAIAAAAQAVANAPIAKVVATAPEAAPVPQPFTAPAGGATVQQVALAAVPIPAPRPDSLTEEGLEVVTRVSTAGGRHWGINLGRFNSRGQAERILLKTALVELGTLDTALRKVVPTIGGYDANFIGLTEESADLACRRLSARSMECSTLGPG